MKERGVERIDIVVSDDLPGIENASSKVFPSSDHQLCVVHAMRTARTKVRRTDLEEVFASLKPIYRAESQDEAQDAFAAFSERWKKRYPGLAKYWRESLCHLTVFLRYPKPVRPYIYTTNQLERIGKEIKRRIKSIEVFSSEESLLSVLYLILTFDNEKLQKKWLRGFVGLFEEG